MRRLRVKLPFLWGAGPGKVCGWEICPKRGKQWCEEEINGAREFWPQTERTAICEQHCTNLSHHQPSCREKSSHLAVLTTITLQFLPKAAQSHETLQLYKLILKGFTFVHNTNTPQFSRCVFSMLPMRNVTKIFPFLSQSLTFIFKILCWFGNTG